MKRIATFLAAGILFLCPTVFAAVPQLINFQGVLKDGSGNPVANGPYSVTFTIYDAASGGNNLWTETQSVATSSGLFAVLLGSSNPVPDTAFKGSERWLGIAVSPDPEMPRQRLVSVSYAYRVNSVDSASGGTITSKVSIGPGHTNSGINAFIAGANNTAIGSHSTVGGGTSNLAGNFASTVGGGETNTASGLGSTVSGGRGNVASFQDATVGGGASNTASGLRATVGGGVGNVAIAAVATVGGGYYDTASGLYSTVSGGILNLADDTASTVGGGSHNRARGIYSVVSGGGGANIADSNSALGDHSTVSGGWVNIASGEGSTVGGGAGNTASGYYSTVNGGLVNEASGSEATVGGGGGLLGNKASGDNSTIGGGESNIASARSATVGGGGGNTASNYWATIGGGSGNTASKDYATIGGGSNNRARGLYSVISGGGGGTLSDSNLALGSHSTVGGGRANRALGDSSTVGGGSNNVASLWGATVGGGTSNSATGIYATVAGGVSNTATGGCFVGGGTINTANGNYCVVGGGSGNSSTGFFQSTVSGGSGNSANGSFATVPGGLSNSASGDYSFSCGRRAIANHSGAFVWGDATDADFISTASNQFLIRASGGVGIGTNAPSVAGGTGLDILSSSGHGGIAFKGNGGSATKFALLSTTFGYLSFYDATNLADRFSISSTGNVGIGTTSPAALLHVNGTAGNGTGVWSTVSDRRLKEDIEPIQNALETVEQLQPVSFRWKNAQKDAQFGRVRGLIAQDVEKVIPEWIKTDPDGYKRIEPIGVDALLIEAIKEQQKQIEELKDEIAKLKNQPHQTQVEN